MRYEKREVCLLQNSVCVWWGGGTTKRPLVATQVWDQVKAEAGGDIKLNLQLARQDKVSLRSAPNSSPGSYIKEGTLWLLLLV